MFIGEAAFLRKGLGRAMLRAVAGRLLVDPGVLYLILDPQEANAQAVACYAAVGFMPVRVAHTPEGACLLMRMGREAPDVV